jgi:hypothetical protein
MSSFSPTVNLNSGDFVYQMRGNGIWRFGGNGERPNLNASGFEAKRLRAGSVPGCAV